MKIIELIHDWSDRRLAALTLRQRKTCRNSHLNWHFETRNLIAAEVKAFASRQLGRWEIPPLTNGEKTIQILLYPDEIGIHNGGSIGDTIEASAKLEYSILENGTIQVRAWAHKSTPAVDTSHSNSREPYILDIVRDAWQLAGPAGRQAIRRHLRMFVRLSVYTRANVRPSTTNRRYLQRLDDRSVKFSIAYSLTGNRNRHGLSHEASLAIALIAGLVPGVVLPFFRDLAKDAGDRARANHDLCAKLQPDIWEFFQRCLSSRNHWFDDMVSSTFTTGNIIFFTLLLTVLLLYATERSARRS